jgi:hypothetical protein
MALDSKNMSRIAHANGNNVWIYKTADAIATVIAANYFNAMTKEIFQHDIIIAVTSIGGAVAIDVLTVTSASGAASVTTANGT